MLLNEEIPSYYDLIGVKGFKCENGLVYTDNQCYMNSLFNLKHGLANLNLHPVYGSLGLGRQANPFFEFGGLNFTTINDFISSTATNTDAAGRTSLDAHVWLEDDQGQVYDYVTPSLRRICTLRGNQPIDPTLTTIRGLTKTALRQRGMCYLPAPLATQRALAQAFSQSWNDTYNLLMKHFYGRVYDVNVSMSP